MRRTRSGPICLKPARAELPISPSSTLLRFADKIALSGSGLVLDVACGYGRNAVVMAPPASPPPVSDQNQRIVREPATTPDHDTPQADGYCLVGRVASRPGWPRPHASNRPAIETPGRFRPSNAQASATRKRPDWTPSKTSSRSNSFLLIDTTGTAQKMAGSRQKLPNAGRLWSVCAA